MASCHRPRIYRSAEGCCICGAKSSSSRFVTAIVCAHITNVVNYLQRFRNNGTSYNHCYLLFFLSFPGTMKPVHNLCNCSRAICLLLSCN